MYHNSWIDIEFESSVAGKLFNIELRKAGVLVEELFTDITAGVHTATISDDSIADDDDYTVRVVSATNTADYKDSKEFVIQKKLRVGCKVESRL